MCEILSEFLSVQQEKKMADKKTRKIVVSPQRGMTHDVVTRLKLILKLMGDGRVSPWVKLIPIGAIAYLVSPIDIIMGIPGVAALDDAAILWMGSNLFVELCPQNVVQEHMKELDSNLEDTSDEIVDVKPTDVNDV
jgi:uncharacterized membrane protein YkvA (DUF1232 family)